jgi:hypothetical protein
LNTKIRQYESLGKSGGDQIPILAGY